MFFAEPQPFPVVRPRQPRVDESCRVGSLRRSRPAASSENARATMRANRRVSARETAFRLALWHAGARGYRLRAHLPGRPDLVFPSIRLAIFVNGCFWHLCEECRLPMPSANADFWTDKLLETRRRDLRVLSRLRDMGWVAITVWEHEIRPSVGGRAAELAGQIRELRAGLGRG